MLTETLKKKKKLKIDYKIFSKAVPTIILFS